jgi:murein L,D-transpeptidase YafK
MLRLMMGFALGLVALPTPTESGVFASEQQRYSRVRKAFERQRQAVHLSFVAAGAAWPPKRVLLRAYKLEGVLELFAQDARKADDQVLVRRLPVCAPSGDLGPKSAAGDLQVPEGIYRIDRFNPASRFHLSLGINYPNAADRQRSSAADLGGDIFIHGGCVTIGCLPMTDALMEWLYVAAVVAHSSGQAEIPVQILPCRFEAPRCQAELSRRAQEQPELGKFWARLRQPLTL